MKRIKESEKVIEKLFNTIVEKHKGWSIKLVPTYISGLPDRIALLPGAVIFFVEFKSTGVKPTEIQLLRHERLRRLGFEVYVIDSTEQVYTILSKYLIL